MKSFTGKSISYSFLAVMWLGQANASSSSSNHLHVRWCAYEKDLESGIQVFEQDETSQHEQVIPMIHLEDQDISSISNSFNAAWGVVASQQVQSDKNQELVVDCLLMEADVEQTTFCLDEQVRIPVARGIWGMTQHRRFPTMD